MMTQSTSPSGLPQGVRSSSLRFSIAPAGEKSAAACVTLWDVETTFSVRTLIYPHLNRVTFSSGEHVHLKVSSYPIRIFGKY